jgi:hypothetical protein
MTFKFSNFWFSGGRGGGVSIVGFKVSYALLLPDERYGSKGISVSVVQVQLQGERYAVHTLFCLGSTWELGSRCGRLTQDTKL